MALASMTALLRLCSSWNCSMNEAASMVGLRILCHLFYSGPRLKTFSSLILLRCIHILLDPLGLPVYLLHCAGPVGDLWISKYNIPSQNLLTVLCRWSIYMTISDKLVKWGVRFWAKHYWADRNLEKLP